MKVQDNQKKGGKNDDADQTHKGLNRLLKNLDDPFDCEVHEQYNGLDKILGPG